MVATTLSLVKLARFDGLPPIYSNHSKWYRSWYFGIRLNEEISRSTRYQLPFSLLVLHLAELPKSRVMRARLTKHLTEIATALRQPDIPAVLSDGELAVLLPHTSRLGAQNVIDRLVLALEPFSATVGASSYPEDGVQAETLLLVAKHRAMALQKRVDVSTHNRKQLFAPDVLAIGTAT